LCSKDLQFEGKSKTWKERRERRSRKPAPSKASCRGEIYIPPKKELLFFFFGKERRYAGGANFRDFIKNRCGEKKIPHKKGKGGGPRRYLEGGRKTPELLSSH